MSLLPKTTEELIALIRAFRSKPYVTFPGILVAVGAALSSASLGTLIFEYVTSGGVSSSNNQPWWVATLIGGFLIATGVVLFSVFYIRDVAEDTDGRVSYTVPQNIQFETIAHTLGVAHERIVILRGFEKAELETPLRRHAIQEKNLKDALLALRHLATANTIREFKVTEEGQTIIITPV